MKRKKERKKTATATQRENYLLWKKKGNTNFIWKIRERASRTQNRFVFIFYHLMCIRVCTLRQNSSTRPFFFKGTRFARFVYNSVFFFQLFLFCCVQIFPQDWCRIEIEKVLDGYHWFGFRLSFELRIQIDFFFSFSYKLVRVSQAPVIRLENTYIGFENQFHFFKLPPSSKNRMK